MLKSILSCSGIFATSILLAGQIKNGGFEIPGTEKSNSSYIVNIAESWQGILQSGIKNVRAELSDDAHSGKKSYKFHTLKEKAFIGVYQTIECTPNSEITISAWIKRGKIPAS